MRHHKEPRHEAQFDRGRLRRPAGEPAQRGAQLVEALPKLADAASDKKLKQAFAQHLAETQVQLERLDQVIATWASPRARWRVRGDAGPRQRGREGDRGRGAGPVKDVALIAVAQRIAHYEIAVYGTARALADQLDQREARELLSQSLDEESQADELLTKLATGGLILSGINERAQG